jgi:hypothetical protein
MSTNTVVWSSDTVDAAMRAFGPCEMATACDEFVQPGTEVWACEDTGGRNVCPDCRAQLAARFTCPFCGDGFDGTNVCGG